MIGQLPFLVSGFKTICPLQRLLIKLSLIGNHTFNYIGTIASHQGRQTALGSHTEDGHEMGARPAEGAHIINDGEEDRDDRIVLIALLAALRKQKVDFKNKRT